MKFRPSVCMMTNLFPPVVSGSSTQSAALARELALRGCHVVVITARLSADQPPYMKMGDVHVYRLPAVKLPKHEIALNFPWLNFTFTPANQVRIHRILETHRTEVLHLHNHMFDLAFSAVTAAERNAIPLVVTLHTIVKHPRNIYNFLLYPLDRILLNHQVIRRAEALICPDKTIEGYARETFGNSRTVIVPYGIDIPPQADASATAQIKEKYGLEGRPIILSLGHVHEIRNRLDLIRAMPLVLQEFPRAVLLIVGSIGTDRPFRLAESLGIGDVVIFTGSVSHDIVPAFLEIATLEAHWFQVNNPQNKTLGIAALEAMGAGKAVVNTADEDVYGRGVLRNGQNIFLIESDNSVQQAEVILNLLRDDVKRTEIGWEARKTIQAHFSWESVCSRTLTVYERTLRTLSH